MSLSDSTITEKIALALEFLHGLFEYDVDVVASIPMLSDKENTCFGIIAGYREKHL